MSIISATSSTTTVSQVEVPNCRITEFNAQIHAEASDRILSEAIGKLINLNEIVDRLQAADCQQCAPFTTEQVKLTFLKWIENHLESSEMQPEWFIHRDFKHFNRYLPELDGSLFPEKEYDRNAIYEEQAAQYAAELAATELVATDHQPSQLENEFERTPREEATATINW